MVNFSFYKKVRLTRRANNPNLSASSLDLGSGEYTLVLQSKNIMIFTGGYIGGRELAAICVMKKRDGRLRVTVNSEVGDRVEAFKDLTVNNAQKIFDEPIFKDTDIRELSKDELTVIARLLFDWVHIEKVEGGSGHHEVKFMNPLKVPEVSSGHFLLCIKNIYSNSSLRPSCRLVRAS